MMIALKDESGSDRGESIVATSPYQLQRQIKIELCAPIFIISIAEDDQDPHSNFSNETALEITAFSLLYS